MTVEFALFVAVECGPPRPGYPRARREDSNKSAWPLRQLDPRPPNLYLLGALCIPLRAYRNLGSDMELRMH